MSDPHAHASRVAYAGSASDTDPKVVEGRQLSPAVVWTVQLSLAVRWSRGGAWDALDQVLASGSAYETPGTIRR